VQRGTQNHVGGGGNGGGESMRKKTTNCSSFGRASSAQRRKRGICTDREARQLEGIYGEEGETILRSGR